MDKTRAGIQSVEVGFALVDALARASGSRVLRNRVSCQRLGRVGLGPAARQLSHERGHTA